MFNFFKRFFRFKREVVVVDYENRVAYFTTHCYPETSSLLILIQNHRPHYFIVDGYVKNGDVYNLQTPNGLYLLRYL